MKGTICQTILVMKPRRVGRHPRHLAPRMVALQFPGIHPGVCPVPYRPVPYRLAQYHPVAFHPGRCRQPLARLVRCRLVRRCRQSPSSGSPRSYGAGDPGNQLAVGVGPRIGARLIDSIALFALLFFPLALVFGIIGAMLAGSQDPAALQSATQQQQVSAVASLAGLIVSVPAYLINEVVLVKLKGWNIGKVALGQRVVDAQTGAFLSWGQAFKRFLFYYGPGLLANIIGAFVGPTVSAIFTVVVFVYYIALAVSIARGGPLFQGWHDKFAGSKVIKKPAF